MGLETRWEFSWNKCIHPCLWGRLFRFETGEGGATWVGALWGVLNSHV